MIYSLSLGILKDSLDTVCVHSNEKMNPRHSDIGCEMSQLLLPSKHSVHTMKCYALGPFITCDVCQAELTGAGPAQ